MVVFSSLTKRNMENSKYQACYVVEENIVELQINKGKGGWRLFSQTRKKLIISTIGFQELLKDEETVAIVIDKILGLFATQKDLDCLQAIRVNNIPAWVVDNDFDICFMLPEEY